MHDVYKAQSQKDTYKKDSEPVPVLKSYLVMVEQIKKLINNVRGCLRRKTESDVERHGLSGERTRGRDSHPSPLPKEKIWERALKA